VRTGSLVYEQQGREYISTHLHRIVDYDSSPAVFTSVGSVLIGETFSLRDVFVGEFSSVGTTLDALDAFYSETHLP
jgi:hypothetical protein